MSAVTTQVEPQVPSCLRDENAFYNISCIWSGRTANTTGGTKPITTQILYLWQYGDILVTQQTYAEYNGAASKLIKVDSQIGIRQWIGIRKLIGRNG